MSACRQPTAHAADCGAKMWPRSPASASPGTPGSSRGATSASPTRCWSGSSQTFRLSEDERTYLFSLVQHRPPRVLAGTITEAPPEWCACSRRRCARRRDEPALGRARLESRWLRRPSIATTASCQWANVICWKYCSPPARAPHDGSPARGHCTAAVRAPALRLQQVRRQSEVRSTGAAPECQLAPVQSCVAGAGFHPACVWPASLCPRPLRGPCRSNTRPMYRTATTTSGS